MPRRRSSPAPRAPLSVDRIARAALAIVEESGYAAVSMRAVAERLDTGQASLYAHVRGKADLDRVMIEQAWSEVDFATDGSWRDQLASDAEKVRALYARYPGLALASFASLPRGEADLVETRLRAMHDAGLTVRQAHTADVAVGLLATVRAIEDAVIAERINESGVGADAWWQRVREFVAEGADDHPLFSGSGEFLTPEAREWLSRELVEVFLDGIEARYLRAT